MDINTLNNLWVEAGHNVEDLNEQINNALNDDNFSAEAFADLKDKRDNAKVRRDALKDQLVEAQAIATIETPKAPLNDEELEIKDQFVNDFKNLVYGNYTQIKNVVSSDETDGAGHAGLTIPKDIQTTIHLLVRQYDSLQEYVNVESAPLPRTEKWRMSRSSKALPASEQLSIQTRNSRKNGIDNIQLSSCPSRSWLIQALPKKTVPVDLHAVQAP